MNSEYRVNSLIAGSVGSNIIIYAINEKFYGPVIASCADSNLFSQMFIDSLEEEGRVIIPSSSSTFDLPGYKVEKVYTLSKLSGYLFTSSKPKGEVLLSNMSPNINERVGGFLQTNWLCLVESEIEETRIPCILHNNNIVIEKKIIDSLTNNQLSLLYKFSIKGGYEPLIIVSDSQCLGNCVEYGYLVKK